jgi:hypothetical protein
VAQAENKNLSYEMNIENLAKVPWGKCRYKLTANALN